MIRNRAWADVLLEKLFYLLRQLFCLGDPERKQLFKPTKNVVPTTMTVDEENVDEKSKKSVLQPVTRQSTRKRRRPGKWWEAPAALIANVPNLNLSYTQAIKGDGNYSWAALIEYELNSLLQKGEVGYFFVVAKREMCFSADCLP